MQKRGKRRWLFKKASSDSCARDVGLNTKNAANTNSAAVDAIAEDETEKNASPAAKEAVFFCRTSVYLKRHLAAILIQTAYRGYLVKLILTITASILISCPVSCNIVLGNSHYTNLEILKIILQFQTILRYIYAKIVTYVSFYR